MPRKIAGKTYYQTSEVCEFTGISKGTLFRWIRIGIIEDVKTKDRNGWRLFTKEDIERIKKEAYRFGG